jgi:hypothetical protein
LPYLLLLEKLYWSRFGVLEKKLGNAINIPKTPHQDEEHERPALEWKCFQKTIDFHPRAVFNKQVPKTNMSQK